MRNRREMLLCLICLVGLGCQSSTPTENGETPSVKTKTESVNANNESMTQADSLVVYSGRSAKLVDPIFERFEALTNIKVKVRTGKSDELANRLAVEAEKSEADVIFLQESGYLEALGRKGLLKSPNPSSVERVPAQFRGTGNHWLSVSGRARVLVYSTADLKAEELPKSLEALADPKWKGRLGWAPSNASFEAHISALRHLWGEAKTKAWLEKMNALEPKKYPKNSPQVRAVATGEIQIGWVNHYYLMRQKVSEPDIKAANFVFPTEKDAGNIMMMSGVAIAANTKNLSAANRFVEFLLSDEIQQVFTEKNFEYPVVTTVKPASGLEELGGSLSLVPQDRLTDIAGTQRLLQSVGLR